MICVDCRLFGFVFFFFFQAEDGIRDDLVTGVQTCALPISSVLERHGGVVRDRGEERALVGREVRVAVADERSEERRVGKECRSRWSRCHEKKKTMKTEHEVATMRHNRSNNSRYARIMLCRL